MADLVIAMGPAGAAQKPMLCLPASALAEGGAEPEVGDEVSAQIEGTVQKARDGYVWASVTSVNGKSVKEPEKKEEGPPKKESFGEMGSRLAKEARKEDSERRMRGEKQEELI